MPYVDIEDLIRKQRKSEIDNEVRLRNTGWGEAIDEMEDIPRERSGAIGKEKVCEICGETFTAKRKSAMFCSARCQRLRYSGVEHNGEIMTKLEKFAVVYQECNHDITKATNRMEYKSVDQSRRSLTRAKGEGLL